MITYLIIDDEHIAHDIIKNYCDLLPNMQLMKNCYDGLEAFEYLNKNDVDLIFLDLNIKAINKTFSASNTQEVVSSKNNAVSKRIFLRSNKKHTQVEIDVILFVEASGNYTKVITTLETITVREKISSVLDILPKEDFLQVHKSFAVAPKHIKSIEGNRIFISDHIIPIGKFFRTNIVQLLQ